MTLTALLLALILWAPDAASARQKFSSCLHELARDNLKQKTKPDQFDALVATACTKEESAFRSAVVEADVARGISRKTSEQGVADEVTDYRTDVKESYRGDFEAENKPS